MQKELNEQMRLSGKAKVQQRNNKLAKANLESRTSYGVRLSCLQLTNLSSEIEKGVIAGYPVELQIEILKRTLSRIS